MVPPTILTLELKLDTLYLLELFIELVGYDWYMKYSVHRSWKDTFEILREQLGEK